MVVPLADLHPAAQVVLGLGALLLIYRLAEVAWRDLKIRFRK